MKSLILWPLCCLFFFSCQNDPSPDHQSALPHNSQGGLSRNLGGELSTQEADELAHAEGKTAKALSVADFLKSYQNDTTALVAVNFYQKGCDQCLEIQHHLENIQLKLGEGKLKLYLVSLDEAAGAKAFDMLLRKEGFTAEALLVGTLDPAARESFSQGWTGSLPAFTLRTGDGLRQFYTQSFSEAELMALVEPLVL